MPVVAARHIALDGARQTTLVGARHSDGARHTTLQRTRRGLPDRRQQQYRPRCFDSHSFRLVGGCRSQDGARSLSAQPRRPPDSSR